MLRTHGPISYASTAPTVFVFCFFGILEGFEQRGSEGLWGGLKLPPSIMMPWKSSDGIVHFWGGGCCELLYVALSLSISWTAWCIFFEKSACWVWWWGEDCWVLLLFFLWKWNCVWWMGTCFLFLNYCSILSLARSTISSFFLFIFLIKRIDLALLRSSFTISSCSSSFRAKLAK